MSYISYCYSNINVCEFVYTDTHKEAVARRGSADHRWIVKDRLKASKGWRVREQLVGLQF